MSQFSPQEGKTTLADLDYTFPRDVYPVGRLDHDSEGLLILTNDKSINSILLFPEHQHKKIYIVQVEGMLNKEELNLLESGVEISAKGKIHTTAPATVKLIEQPKWITERSKPVKQGLTTSWLELTVTEGKNRQVRKMTAAIGYPTLRLIRYAIEDITIDNLVPGRVIELSKNTFIKKAHLKDELLH